jgi:transposase-like protein
MYTVKNQYYKNSKLSEEKFLALLKSFVEDKSASDTARQIGISVRSVNDIYLKIRNRLTSICIDNQVADELLVQSDSKFLGRVKGKKVLILACPKTKKISAELVAGDITAVPGKESTLDQEGLSHTFSFLRFVEQRLIKFKGVSNSTFVLHLKESEFRYNNREDDLYKIVLGIISANPI